MATESENQNRPHTSQATAEQGEACFSDLLAKKQGFLAADSFLFWNADDVRPIRDRPMASEPPSRLQLHTGRSQETAKGHWPWGGGGGGGSPQCFCAFLSGPPAIALFLAMASAISFGLEFRLQTGGLPTSKGRASRAGQSLGRLPLCGAHEQQGEQWKEECGPGHGWLLK